MTKKQYGIYINTLTDDCESAFFYKGVKYFIHLEENGWNIDRVLKSDKEKNEFVFIQCFSSIEELVSEKILDNHSLNEIYPEIDFADF